MTNPLTLDAVIRLGKRSQYMEDDLYAAGWNVGYQAGLHNASAPPAHVDPSVHDLLVEVSEVLDNYVDVEDGDGGTGPVRNRAMQLKARIDAML